MADSRLTGAGVTEVTTLLEADWLYSVTKIAGTDTDGRISVANFFKVLGIASAINTDVDTGTENVDTFDDTDGDGCVWDYIVKNGANLRTGTIAASWDATGDTIEYNESATNDVGDTSGLALGVDINADTVRLRATAGSDDWTVKVVRTLL